MPNSTRKIEIPLRRVIKISRHLRVELIEVALLKGFLII